MKIIQSILMVLSILGIFCGIYSSGLIGHNPVAGEIYIGFSVDEPLILPKPYYKVVEVTGDVVKYKSSDYGFSHIDSFSIEDFRFLTKKIF